VIDATTFETLESIGMANLTGGLISGLIFGVVTVGLMLPMQFPDKTTALLAAVGALGGLVIGGVLHG
jgi:hypothetical protein